MQHGGRWLVPMQASFSGWPSTRAVARSSSALAVISRAFSCRSMTTTCKDCSKASSDDEFDTGSLYVTYLTAVSLVSSITLPLCRSRNAVMPFLNSVGAKKVRLIQLFHVLRM